MTCEPPTIAHLKGHGPAGVFVVCANAACMHATAFNFGALGLADDVPFPSIASCRRFLCTQCGGRAVNVSPDWRTRRAVGMGDGPHERSRYEGAPVSLQAMYLKFS